MQLPYFFDMIPEKLGRFYAELFNWRPEGKRISLRVIEGEEGFYGTTVSARIIRTEEAHNASQRANNVRLHSLLELDSLWTYPNRATSSASMVLTIPRFRWHGPYRLLFSEAVVYVFPFETPEGVRAVAWDNMIAICEMKLIRNRTQ